VCVASTNKSLESVYERQRDHINATFSKTSQDVDTLEPIFKGMSDKINKIQAIWLLILKDSQTLANKLSDMKSTNYEVALKRYATTLEATYGALYFTLEQYSLAVQCQHRH